MAPAVQVYNPEKVQEMMDDLQKECVTMMLFLRNVESLQVLDWQQGQEGPDVRFTCSLQGITAQLRAQRALFGKASAGPPQQLVQGSHRLHFSVATVSAPAEQHTYLVSQLKGTQARALELAAKASKTFGAPAIPWGCVAARLPQDTGRWLTFVYMRVHCPSGGHWLCKFPAVCSKMSSMVVLNLLSPSFVAPLQGLQTDFAVFEIVSSALDGCRLLCCCGWACFLLLAAARGHRPASAHQCLL